jgi:peptide/nickel transport system substrate-binding protein
MYKKLRFYKHFFLAFISKYLLLIFLGMLLSIAMFFLIPGIFTHLPQFRTTRNIGLIGRYSLSDIPSEILQKISIGLTTVDPSGRPSPGIAKSWEISEDGKTFSFTLDDSLHWQNGNRITSRDIQYQFRDAQFDYPDDQHLVIRLKDPFSPLPVLLSKPVLLIQSSKFISRTEFYGLGNYSLNKFKTNGSLLDSVTLYPVLKDSSLPILKYNFYSSSLQARIAYKLGLIDEIEDIPDPGDLDSWPNTQIVSQPVYNRYVGLFFNTQDGMFSGQSGKTLRTALSYAIDKSVWNNIAYGPISPQSWAFNPDVKKYNFDANKTLELLKKVEKLPETINISTVPIYFDTARIIKSDWEKFGLKVNISVSPDIPDNFQVLLVAQAIPLDPDQYNLWHSTREATNLTRLNNPRIDKLLEDGRKTYDLQSRIKIYLDFQKYLVEESPVAFLFYPESYTIIRK